MADFRFAGFRDGELERAVKKFCIITGSRAEWGLLSPLASAIQKDSSLELQIIATNMHLSPEFGLTWKEIEEDGFHISRRIPMLLSGDTACETVKSCGVAMLGFADAFQELQPDAVILLGDRYEMLAAAYSALLFKIPIVHIHGGEITEGAYDNAIRHAITKMSSLHFTSTEEYRRNIIQMGEDPSTVFWVGAPGCQNIRNTAGCSREELEEFLGFSLDGKSLLVTYHPVTLQAGNEEERIENLLAVLAEYPDYNVIFTQSNSDTGGRIITQKIRDYISKHPGKACLFSSLGKKRYFTALRHVTAVVGNSSSGLIEAPSFGIPTLDIGIRQRGRCAADSVVHCDATLNGIREGMKKILDEGFIAYCRNVRNPYEKPDTVEMIKKIISEFPLKQSLQKHFYRIEYHV